MNKDHLKLCVDYFKATGDNGPLLAALAKKPKTPSYTMDPNQYHAMQNYMQHSSATALPAWSALTASGSAGVSGAVYPAPAAAVPDDEVYLESAEVELGLDCPSCGALNKLTTTLPVKKFKQATCSKCEATSSWLAWRAKNWPLRSYEDRIRELLSPDPPDDQSQSASDPESESQPPTQTPPP